VLHDGDARSRESGLVANAGRDQYVGTGSNLRGITASGRRHSSCLLKWESWFAMDKPVMVGATRERCKAFTLDQMA
jgi:hypothetical protein